jgi:hypothetical protein
VSVGPRPYPEEPQGGTGDSHSAAADAPAPASGPVTPVKAPVTPVKAPVTPVKAPVTPVKAPVTPVKAPVTPVKAPVTPVKAPVTPVKAPVTTTTPPPAFTLPAFSAAARTGVSLTALATWDQDLPRPCRALVPIDVQALVVAPGATVTAVPVLPQLVNPQDPASGQVPPVTQVMPPVPPFTAASARPPGVYLHWAAPDGLTATSSPLTPGPSGSGATAGLAPSMRPLADRWLVVRIGGGIPRRTQAWIIESERCLVTDLATWTPSSIPPAANAGATPNFTSAQLTAIAGGDPAWAAVYDAVQNRFAMHDDLSDLDPADAAGPLSYLVCGWWSQDENDPLYAPDLTAYADRVTALRWAIPPVPAVAVAGRDLQAQRAAGLGYDQPHLATGNAIDSAGTASGAPTAPVHRELAAVAGNWYAGQAGEYPQLSLLHGCVLGLLPQGGGTDLMPTASEVEIGVGASATEAFAAIISAAAAAGDPDTPADEQLVEAFSQGLITQLDAPDGLVAVDQAVHAAGFSGQPAPSTRTDRVLDGDILAHGAAAVAGSLSAEQQQAASAASATVQGASAEISSDRISGLMQTRSLHETFDAFTLKQQASVLAGGPGTTGSAAPAALTVRDIVVAAETWKQAIDPVVTVRGAVRSLRHGYDGRLTADGTLACRVSGLECTSFDGLVNGADIVTPLGNGALPPECDSLLQELVLDDPYRVTDVAAFAANATGLPQSAVLSRLTAEHALRWDISMPAHGKDLLRSVSLRRGTEASLIATTAWTQPWIPLYLEWQLSLQVDANLGRWSLSDVDLEPIADPDPGAAQSTLSYSGRSLLTSAAARTFGAKVQAFINDEDARSQSAPVVQPEQLASLSSLAAAASQIDVLSAALSELRPQLLGLSWADSSRTSSDGSGSVTPVSAVAPPILLRGGVAWFTALRLVDAFGRTVDLSSNPVAISSQLSPPAPAAGSGAATPAPAKLMLRPRATLPARLLLDLVDASAPDGTVPALAMIDQSDPANQVSPLSGWLLPDHLDGALEVYDESANPLGMLLEDVNDHVIWEGAPGLPGPVGAPPAPAVADDLACRHIVRFAAGLVAADTASWQATPAPAQSALASLLRAIDTTAWTCDPLGVIGTEHQSALVGRPIAVLRMTVALEVDDNPADIQLKLDAPSLTAFQQAGDQLSSQLITVRIGELTRTDDSVLGYFVDDNYTLFTPVSPEVLAAGRASGRLQGQLGTLGSTGPGDPPAQDPIAHPYVDASETPLSLRPGQVITLTVLMAPGGAAYATSGIVPRVRTALARDWIAESLKVLSPTFRLGPVLVDPATVRLPRATGLPVKQVFTRRTDPMTWEDDPVAAVTQDALLPDAPAVTREGWLRAPAPPPAG